MPYMSGQSHTTTNTGEQRRQMLTVVDVMKQLQVSRTTLHKLTASGKLRSYRIENRVRYDQRDVDTYLATVAL